MSLIPDINASSSSSQHDHRPPLPTKLEESDDDLFTVPDMEAPISDSGAASKDAATAASVEVQLSHSASTSGKRRRVRNPADREYKRLKRLLRNRVSAQQARERKKLYVNDLELKARELQDKNLKLEEKISTLINENTMLRKVLLNTRPKGDETTETQNDQSGNS